MMSFRAAVVCVLALTFASSSTDDSFFQITEGKIEDLGTMRITNTKTGEYVVIVTDYGGRVEELYLASQSTGKIRNVLLSHHGNSSAIKENKFWKGMLLMPYANRINRGKYTFYNNTYQLPLNDEPRVNALHGFLPKKKLNIVSKVTTDTLGILCTSVEIYNEPGYPFKLDVHINYTLDTSGFMITVMAFNANGDGTPLPFFMGWHPYFHSTAYSTIVQFDPCSTWVHVDINANMDPTGYTTKKNPFDGSKPVGGKPGQPTFYDDEYKSLSSGSLCKPPLKTHIHDMESGQTVVLWQDFDNRIVHVYTGYTVEECVVVEPMSGLADAYNNHDGLSVLSDGQSWEGSFGIYVQ